MEAWQDQQLNIEVSMEGTEALLIVNRMNSYKNPLP
jgi:hypothetical protein